MSKDILEKIQQLLDSNLGEPGRLEHIRDSIVNEKTLYDSDQRYLESIISKYRSETKNHLYDNICDKDNSSSLNTTNDDQNPHKETDPINDLKRELDDTRHKINLVEKRIDSQEKRTRLDEYKSESTTLILSILLGLFGIMGVGHIYIGKIKRGLIAMAIGFSLWTIVLVPFTLLGVYQEFDDEFMLNDIKSVDYSNDVTADNGMVILLGFVFAFVVVFVGYFVLYIWQIFDSRKLCKVYNHHLEEYGKPPW